uniref:Uncharacterized protein n=1 Tax=Rhizophora mucronata TaxID=61149 RepID=A0A2P2PJW2_RHIMU
MVSEMISSSFSSIWQPTKHHFHVASLAQRGNPTTWLL